MTCYDYRPTAKIFLTQGAWHQSPTSVAGGFAEERCADLEARKCLVNHGTMGGFGDRDDLLAPGEAWEFQNWSSKARVLSDLS